MTDLIMPSGSPGCFGSVLSYDTSDAICSGCAFMGDCGEAAHKAMSEIRKDMDVPDLENKFDRDQVKNGNSIDDSKVKSKRIVSVASRRLKLTPQQLEIVDDPSLPIKARKLIGSLYRKGIDGEYMLAALNQGINPFTNEPPKVLRLACDALMQGSILKPDLRRIFERNDMSRGTANSQVSIITSAFLIMKITDPDEPIRIKLRSSL
jgi:hypothetical protein